VALDADPDLPDIRDADPRWVRCAVYTRQSVKRLGDDPAVTSCAIQRTLCTEFLRSKTWEFWYPIAERFDDEGESGATLERPGLAKLLRSIEGGEIHRVIVYRVDRLTRKLADLARLASHLERHRVGLTIVHDNIDADADSLAGLQVNMLATFAEWEIIRERIADTRGAIKARGERSAGRVPLGYRTDPATKQLVTDEGAAAAVRWLLTEAAKGTTRNDLVKKASKKKLAGKAWSARAVLRLLTNPTHAGHRPDGAPGRHASIVSAEVFSKVQALIEAREADALGLMT
jgi:site-specific DNA recombinase